jgi:hypothetical protein
MSKCGFATLLIPPWGADDASSAWGRSQANVASPLCLTPAGGGLGAARPWGRL